MFFSNKEKKGPKCPQCKSKINDSFSFCPYCGENIIDPEEELREFGMLGKNDSAHKKISMNSFGISDQMISSIMSNLIKTLNQEFKETNSMRVENLPNGIKIKIGNTLPSQEGNRREKKEQNKGPTDEQLKKMAALPRSEAKTNIRRFSDKVIYEMSTPGLESPHDVFISKLESGYEIKAIGKKKIYVNSLPINLPIRGYAIQNGHLLVEFKTQEQ